MKAGRAKSRNSYAHAGIERRLLLRTHALRDLRFFFGDHIRLNTDKVDRAVRKDLAITALRLHVKICELIIEQIASYNPVRFDHPSGSMVPYTEADKRAADTERSAKASWYQDEVTRRFSRSTKNS